MLGSGRRVVRLFAPLLLVTLVAGVARPSTAFELLRVSNDPCDSASRNLSWSSAAARVPAHGARALDPESFLPEKSAAARAQLYLAGHRHEEEETPVEPLDLSGPPRVGVMVCHCGVNIAGVLDVDRLANEAAGVAVRKSGVAVVSPGELAARFVHGAHDKIVSRDELASRMDTAEYPARTARSRFASPPSGARWRKAIWLLFFSASQAARPLKMPHVKAWDRWAVANFLIVALLLRISHEERV